MQLPRVAVEPPVDAAEHHLEHACGGQLAAAGAGEGHRVDNVAQVVVARQLLEPVVELLQVLARPRLVSHLEELDAHLPRWRVQPVQLLGCCDDGALHVVRGLAVGDDDDVDRLGRVWARLVPREIRPEDLVQALAGRGTAAGTHGGEDLVHGGG